jgi:hypothetical protein
MDYQTDPLDNNFWISPKYKANDWRRLNLDNSNNPDWIVAIDIFYDRIFGRFLSPIEAVENHSDENIRRFSGFTILAIDCLIIETLYQFYNGIDETDIDHQKAFWNFFKTSTYFKPHFTRRTAYKFYSHFRCGILHQAQTKMASKVRFAQDNMVQPVDPKDLNQGLIIDREKFHKALRDEIDDYIAKLKHPQSSQDLLLREKFKDKMVFVVR